MAILNRPKPIEVCDDDSRIDEEVVTEIELSEFLEARKDPTWRDFVAKSKAYRAELRRAGASN